MKTRKLSLCIILPAYNEEPVIGSVLESLKKYLVTGLSEYNVKIVVINDGSRDNTYREIVRKGVTVLSHPLNCGLGAALATGMTYAKQGGFDIALTMDSDGQHDPHDIKPALMPIIDNTADIVIGTRMQGQKGMPLDRVIVTRLGSLLTWILFGVWTTDSQSGFRVFNRKALDMIRIKTQGMEVSSEIFAEISKHNLQFQEVPIKVIYTDYSRTKGQSNLNSINILVKLLLRLFR